MGLINRCPHVHISGIYGDEINHCGGYRLSCDDCGRLLDGSVSLAKPAPRIIRTLEELEALDPDTALTLYTWKEATIWEASFLQSRFEDDGYTPDLPATIIATGAQVRAARAALEKWIEEEDNATN